MLLLVLGAPGTARAGPYFGDWGWCWKPGKDCPKGGYSCLHYWVPYLYRVCYCVHPAYLDEFPPGLPVPVGWRLEPYPCRTLAPMPTAPYADPAGFYGRPLVPSEEDKKEESKEAK
jgi:hypothetical protein